MDKFTLYLNLLPLLRMIIETVEELASGGTWSGTDKKAKALELLQALWETIGAVGKVKELQQIPFELVKQVAAPLIDILVTLYHFFGRFTHTTAPA